MIQTELLDLGLLDSVNTESDDARKALEEFAAAVTKRFLAAPESLSVQSTNPGRWVADLTRDGYRELGLTLKTMTSDDVDQILVQVFPRYLELEEHEVVPELRAFWSWLKREYGLINAPAILRLLAEIEPDYPLLVNELRLLRMPKSFLMMGIELGFDMANPKEVLTFVTLFNRAILEDHTHRQAAARAEGDEEEARAKPEDR